MSEAITLEAVLTRDRAIVLAGVVGLSALAWAYLLALAWRMPHEDMAMAMAMPHMHAWGAVEVVLTWVMWAVMMVAMMTPSAAPMILTFAAVNRRRLAQQGPLVPTAVFVLGYLLVWGGFSVVATLAQWGLHTAALLSPMIVVTSPVVGGLLLVAAGDFSVDAAQVHVSPDVPLPARLSHDGVAGGGMGGIGNGAPARELLCRVLLGPDGPALCSRGDEPPLGRSHCRLGPGREGAATRGAGRARGGGVFLLAGQGLEIRGGDCLIKGSTERGGLGGKGLTPPDRCTVAGGEAPQGIAAGGPVHAVGDRHEIAHCGLLSRARARVFYGGGNAAILDHMTSVRGST